MVAQQPVVLESPNLVWRWETPPNQQRNKNHHPHSTGSWVINFFLYRGKIFLDWVWCLDIPRKVCWDLWCTFFDEKCKGTPTFQPKTPSNRENLSTPRLGISFSIEGRFKQDGCLDGFVEVGWTKGGDDRGRWWNNGAGELKFGGNVWGTTGWTVAFEFSSPLNWFMSY